MVARWSEDADLAMLASLHLSLFCLLLTRLTLGLVTSETGEASLGLTLILSRISWWLVNCSASTMSLYSDLALLSEGSLMSLISLVFLLRIPIFIRLSFHNT